MWAVPEGQVRDSVCGRPAESGEQGGAGSGHAVEPTAGLMTVPPGFESAVRPHGWRPSGGAGSSAERAREATLSCFAEE